jgi:uncharacterized membrane protein
MTKNDKQNKITSNGMKKFLPYILILVMLAGFFSPAIKVSADSCSFPIYTDETSCKDNGGTWTPQYHLLAPIPCEPGKDAGCTTNGLLTVNPAGGFGSYLNMMIKIFIGICAVLSVVMIVIGGLEVMTSELAHTKESGKERIEHAILGLLIALGAYALLFTINPDLLKSDFNPPSVTPPAVQVGQTGNCILRVSNGPNKVQVMSQAECELRPDSQSWNGTLTLSAHGDCVVKISGGTRTNITTKGGCELNGVNMVSWTPS